MNCIEILHVLAERPELGSGHNLDTGYLPYLIDRTSFQASSLILPAR